ncbi:MAG: DUF465 domain-containing protein [Deltaproteobacteria bacterium]|nr:DUF465 domain-containing protein [Deltaproteobacteria bacterium]
MQQHRDLDTAIFSLEQTGASDQLQLRRLKKMKLDIRYTVVPDPDFKLVDLFRMAAAPLTVIIDAGGIVRYRHEGYEPGDEVRIEEALKSALAGGKVSTK